MNKIYKIVWNAARNCYVVASEFASGKDATGIFRSTYVNQMARRAMASAIVTMAALLTFGFVPAMEGHAYAAAPEVSSTNNHQYVAISAGGNLESTRSWNYVFMTDDNSIVRSSSNGAYSDGSTGGTINSDGSITDGNTVTVNGTSYKFTNYNQGVYTLTATTANADGTYNTLNAYRYGKYTLRNPDNSINGEYRIRADEPGSATPSYNVTIEDQGGYYTSDDRTADGRTAPTSTRVFVVSYQGDGDAPEDILNKVDHVTSATGTSTNLNEQLQTANASTYTSAATGGSTVGGTWDYYIYDDATNSYKNMHTTSGSLPNRFLTTSSSQLVWNNSYNAYVYTPNGGTPTVVPQDNMYVINGQLGIFYNSDGTLYTGTVYGGGNEILLTTSQDGTIYSFWGAQSVDTAQTMQNYPVSKYNGDIATLTNNDEVLAHNDINHVKVEATTNSNSTATATISLYRNGTNMNGDETTTNLVDGQITVTPGGGSGGIANNQANDRTLTIADSESQGNNNHSRTFRVGSTVGVQNDIAGHTLATTSQNLQTLTINGTTYGLKTIYRGDTSTTVSQSLGNTFSITGGADTSNLTTGNIGVTPNGTNGLLVQLAQDLNLTSSGSVTIGNSVLNTNGLTISPSTGDEISMTLDGIKAGGKQITNVASGTTGNVWSNTNRPVSGSTTGSDNWNNAANIGDIYDLIDTQVSVTGTTPNINVTKNSTGTSSYNVALNDNVTLGSGTSTPVNINGSGTNASITLGNTSSTGNYVSFNGTNGSGNVGHVSIGNISSTPQNYTSSIYTPQGSITLDGSTVNLQSVNTTRLGGTTGTTQNGTYITGLTNTDWNWRNLSIDSERAATEAQVLKAGQHYFSVNPQNSTVTESNIPNYYNEGAQGAASMAIGHGVSTDASASQSIAIGAHQTKTSGAQSLAIGYTATTEGLQSMAIGYQADAQGDYSLSIGNRNTANGIRSIALGVDVQSGYQSSAANVGSDNYEAGTMRGGADISIGNKSRVNGTGSTAIGFGAKVGVISENPAIGQAQTFSGDTDLAVALGGRSLASTDGAVALGNLSYANRDSGAVGYGYANRNSSDTTKLIDANGNETTDSSTITGNGAMGSLRATYNDDGTVKTEGSTNNLKAGTAWQANMGAVSIGSDARTGTVTDQDGNVTQVYTIPAITRQLTGLAAGSEDTDAVNVAQLKAVESKGLNFKGNTGDTVHTDAGQTLNVTSPDTNITVTGSDTDKSLSVKLNETVNINTLNAGVPNTSTQGTINIVGQNRNGNYRAASVTAVDGTSSNNQSTIEGNNTQRLQYVEDTTPAGSSTSTSQTHTVATLEDDGLKVAGDAGGTKNVKLNKQVTVSGGATNVADANNIGVTASSDSNGNATLSVKLARDVTGLNSVSAGTDARIGNNAAGTLTVTNSDGSTSQNTAGDYVTGLDNRTWDVDNPSYVSGRAATEDELKTVNDQVSKNKSDISNHETRITNVEQGWNLAVNDATGDDAAKAVTAGKTVTIDNKQSTANQDNIQISRTTDSNNNQTVSLGLNKDVTLGSATGNTASTDVGGSLKVNSGTESHNVSIDGESVKILAGADDTVANERVALGSNENGGYIDLGGGSTSGSNTNSGHLRLYKSTDSDSTGIPRLTYVDPEDDTNPADEHTIATLDDGTTYAGDTGSAKVALNNRVTVTGGATSTDAADSSKWTSGNLSVASEATTTDGSADGNARLTIKLKNELTGINSITNNGNTITFNNTTGGGVTISGGDVSVDGNKITNVKDGDISSTSTDAINGSQLYDVKTTAEKGWVARVANSSGTVDTDNTISVIPDSNTLTYQAGSNINLTPDKSNRTITVATNPDVYFNTVRVAQNSATTGGIYIGNQNTITGDNSNGNTGYFITGLDNTNFDSANSAFSTSTRAATEAQLYQAVNDINQGVVTNDNFVTGANITDGDNGAITGSLTMRSGSNVDIRGLHDYYISDAKLTGNTLTITRNDDTTSADGTHTHQWNIDLSNLITPDWHLMGSGTTADNTDAYSVDDNGDVTLKVTNGTDTRNIKISGLAKNTDGLSFGANSSLYKVNSTDTDYSSTHTVQLGSTQNIIGSATNATRTYSDANITTQLDANGDIHILMDANPTVESVTFSKGGDSTTLNVTNNGDNLTYTVNNSTDSKTIANTDNGLSFQGNNTTVTVAKALKDTTPLKIVGDATTSDAALGENVYVTGNATDGGSLTVRLNKNISGFDTVKAGTDLTIGKQADGTSTTVTGDYVTGLDNKTWDGTNYVSGRGATEDQLRQAQLSITNATTTNTDGTISNNPYGGYGLTGDNLDSSNNRTVVKQNIGSTIDVKGGSNISTKATSTDDEKSLKIDLAQDLANMSSATFNQTTEEGGTVNGTTVVNANGVTITPTGKSGNDVISLGTDGLSNGNNQIKYVASGVGITSSDDAAEKLHKVTSATGDTLYNAVNVGDLQAVVEGAAQRVGLNFAGNTEEKDANGQTVTDSNGDPVKTTISRGNGQTLVIQGNGKEVVDGYENQDDHGWGSSNVRVETNTTSGTLTINTAKDFHVDTLRAGTAGSDNNTKHLGHVKIAGTTTNPAEYQYTDITTGYQTSNTDSTLNPAGNEGTTGMTRLTYQNLDTNGNAVDNTKHTVATLDDGLNLSGDLTYNGNTVTSGVGIGLNRTVSINGGTTNASNLASGNNIGTTVTKDANGNATINLQLNQDLTGLNTVTAGTALLGRQGQGTTHDLTYSTITVNADGSRTVTPVEGNHVAAGSYVTGLNNTTWTNNGSDPTGTGEIVSGRAATEDQLKALEVTVNNKIDQHEAGSTYGLTPDEGGSVTKAVGTTINLQGAVSQDKDGHDATLQDGEGNAITEDTTDAEGNPTKTAKKVKNITTSKKDDDTLEIGLADRLALNTALKDTGSSISLYGKQWTYTTGSGDNTTHKVIQIDPDEGISLLQTDPATGNVKKDGVRITGPSDYYANNGDGTYTRMNQYDSNGSVGITNSTGEFTARMADMGGTGYLGLGNTISTAGATQTVELNQLVRGTTADLSYMDTVSRQDTTAQRDVYGRVIQATDSQGNPYYMMANGTVTTDASKALTQAVHTYYQDSNGNWQMDVDENGNPTTLSLPVYARTVENWVDANGNPVYAVDANGNPLYRDSNGTTTRTAAGNTPISTTTAGALVSARYGTPSLSDAANAPGTANANAQADSNGKVMTRLKYLDEAHYDPLTGTFDDSVVHEVATMDDGLIFSGDYGSEQSLTLNKELYVTGRLSTTARAAIGADASSLARGGTGTGNSGNVKVATFTGSDGSSTMVIALNKDLKGFNTIQVGGTVSSQNGSNSSAVTAQTIRIGNQVNQESGTPNNLLTGENFSSLMRYADTSTGEVAGPQLYEAYNASTGTTYYTSDETDTNRVQRYYQNGAWHRVGPGETAPSGLPATNYGYVTIDNNASTAVQNGTDLSTIAVYAVTDDAGNVLYYTTQQNAEGTLSQATTTLNPGNGRYITGLSNTDWDGEHVDEDRAATEGQLRKLQQQITTYNETSGGFALSADRAATDGGSTTVTQNLGNAIAVNGDGENITTTADDTNKAIKVSLNKDLTVNSVTYNTTDATTGNVTNQTVVNGGGVTVTNNTTGATSSLTDNSLTVNNKTYIDNNGINANNQTITNVANGVNDNDAVNVSQLRQYVTGAQNTVSAGDNIVVDPTTTSNGNQTSKTDYKVSLKNQVTLGKVDDAGTLTVTDGTNSTNVTSNSVTTGSGANSITADGSKGLLTVGEDKAATATTPATSAIKIGNLNETVTTVSQIVPTTDNEGNATGSLTATTGTKTITSGVNYGGTMGIHLASGNTGVEWTKDTADAWNSIDGNPWIEYNDSFNNAANIGDIYAIAKQVNNATSAAPAKTGNNTYVHQEPNSEGGAYVVDLNDDLYLGGDHKTAGSANITIQGDDIKNDAGEVTDYNAKVSIGKQDSGTQIVLDGKEGSVTTGNTTMNTNGLVVNTPSNTTALTGPIVIQQVTQEVNGQNYSYGNVSMGGNQVHNVASGYTGQMYRGRNDQETQVLNNAASIGDLESQGARITNNMSNAINKLGNRVNRVGANSAALAALHPGDFDPDDKLDFAVGTGHYSGANAMAIGAFYRPTEDVMISVGGSTGGGENMVNLGLTFKLGNHNHVTNSRVAMAKDMLAMQAKMDAMAQEIKQLKAGGAPAAAVTETDISFPDVPENHWAYEYVQTLAHRGLLTGYPDGEFKGDRPMTRYEYAAIVYRALQNGAPVDGNMARSMNDFGDEIADVQRAYRFRVDRVAGGDNDRHKIERVRVNDKDDPEHNDYRDVYGSKIQKAETKAEANA